MTTSSSVSSNGHAETLVCAEAVSKKIRTKARETVLLDSVSFTVPKGSLFAITGPSGSGKSTLLHILTGIDWPSSGTVSFADQDIGVLSENQLAQWRSRHVGIIFQFFQLLPTLTAQENILLALEIGGVISQREWHTRAMECLRLVGLEEFAHRLPSELSGGEQQRVAVARAVANDPELVVADEPTGNLDSQSALQVLSLLEDLNRRGKTVIYVTHDSKLSIKATKRVELLDGRLVKGSSEEGAEEAHANQEESA